DDQISSTSDAQGSKNDGVDPAVVNRIKAHPLFSVLKQLHLKVQQGMECCTDQSVYDISDVIESIADIKTSMVDKYDEIDSLMREAICSHALCLRDLFHIVFHTDIFLETHKQKLVERAPLDRVLREDLDENDEDKEEEDDSPVVSPIDHRALVEGMIE
ncbi:hypothetical protein PENTCL1PPCAC_18848, partial [Pristionchus entomophagus]